MIHIYHVAAQNAACLMVRGLLPLLIALLACESVASAQSLNSVSRRILSQSDGVAHFDALMQRPACQSRLTDDESEAVLNDVWHLVRAALGKRFSDPPRGSFLAMSALRLTYCIAGSRTQRTTGRQAALPLLVADWQDFEMLGIFQPNDLLRVLLDYDPGLEDFSHRGHYTVRGEFDDNGHLVNISQQAPPNGYSVFGRVPHWRVNTNQPQIGARWQDRAPTRAEVSRYKQQPGTFQLTRKTDLSALGPMVLAAKLARAADILSAEPRLAELLQLSVAEALLDAAQLSVEMASKPLEFGPAVNEARRISLNRYKSRPHDSARRRMAARFSIGYPLMLYRLGFFSDASQSYHAAAREAIDEFGESSAQFGLAMSRLGERDWQATCSALSEFLNRWASERHALPKVQMALELSDLIRRSGAADKERTRLFSIMSRLRALSLDQMRPSVIENVLFAMSADLRWLRNPGFALPLLRKWISIAREKNYPKVERHALRELAAYTRDLFCQISFAWRNNHWVERSGNYIEFPHNLRCPPEHEIERDRMPTGLGCAVRSFAQLERRLTERGDVVLLPHLSAYSRTDPEEDLATSSTVFLGLAHSREPMAWIRSAQTQSPRNIRPLLKALMLDWFLFSFEGLKLDSFDPRRFVYRSAGRIDGELLAVSMQDAPRDQKAIASIMIETRLFLRSLYSP